MSKSEQGGKQEVASMAWPLAVGMLSFTLMGLVDTLLMGHVSTTAQAGVGLGASLTFACLAFFRGLTTGAQSLVAAADGAGDCERRSRSAGAAVLTGALGGLLVLSCAAAVYESVLQTVVADADVAASCTSYVGVRLWGLPLSLTSFGCLSALQGIGDTKSRMWASLVGNILNVGLDLVLIFGLGPVPAMGEAGAALATVASAAVTCCIYMWRFRRLFGRPRLPGWSVLKSSLQLGFPSGCQSVLNVLAFAVMNLALAKAGPAQLAASQIVLNIASLSFLPGFGVGEAGGVLVGRYLGAGERVTAVKALRSARWLAVWMMSAFGLVFALKGEALASIFSQDLEVVRLTGTLMLFAAAFQLFDAVAMVHLCALRSAGDTRFTLLLTTGAAWGLLVPATLIFGLWLGWGAKGAWLGITLEVAFLAVATGWRVAGLRDGRVGRMDLLLGEPN